MAKRTVHKTQNRAITIISGQSSLPLTFCVILICTLSPAHAFASRQQIAAHLPILICSFAFSLSTYYAL